MLFLRSTPPFLPAGFRGAAAATWRGQSLRFPSEKLRQKAQEAGDRAAPIPPLVQDAPSARPWRCAAAFSLICQVCAEDSFEYCHLCVFIFSRKNYLCRWWCFSFADFGWGVNATILRNSPIAPDHHNACRVAQSHPTTDGHTVCCLAQSIFYVLGGLQICQGLVMFEE